MNATARVTTVSVLGALLLALPGAGPDRPAAIAPKDSVLGVFEGRTPCGAVAVRFTGVSSANCEKIKWKLTLYRDGPPASGGRYAFQGTRTTREGRWTVESGAAGGREAVIYALAPEPRGGVLRVQSIADRVLLLLDDERRPLIGDASWSYTLNRTGP